MRFFLVLSTGIFLCLQTRVFAQRLATDNRLDSLEHALSQATSDTAKASLMQSLGDYWIYKDSAKAMEYILSSLALYHKHEDEKGIGMGHFYKGNIYLEYNHLDSAQQEYEQAEALLQKDSTRHGYRYRARLWHNLGALQQRRGNDREFMDILLNKTVPLLEKAHDTVTLALTYHNIGLILMNNEEYERAIRYYDNAIETLKNYPKYKDLTTSHLYKARTYLFWEKYDAADSTFAVAEKLLQKSEASDVHVLFYTFKGMAHYFKEEYKEALPFFDEGITIANKLQEKYLIQELLLGKYYTLYELEQYVPAKKVLEDLYHRSSNYSVAQNQLVLLNNLVDIEEKTNNLAGAYGWLKEYVKLSDSIHAESSSVKIRELEAKYQAEKSENQILALSNQNQQQELELQKNRFWILLAAVILCLLVVIFVIAFVLVRKRQQIAAQKAQLLEQRVTKMKQEHELKIFSAMLEGQEQERKRLAIDLHDGLGGSLAGIKLKLYTWLQDKPEYVANNGINPIIDQLDNSVNELRRIARNMMPETLLKYGLKTALKDFCQSLENGKHKIILQTYGMKNTIPQASQIMIYRIVQELITNAIKHAQPSEILVQVMQDESHISITVEDDGVGFEIKEDTARYGIGLNNVKTRVEYMKGKMELNSEPHVGTSISVEIDLENGR